jgi:hypothetical protein
MSNNKQTDHIVEANKMVTAVDLIIAEIDNELRVIENLYGSEIMGRKIGLAFTKRFALQLKKTEQNQIIDAYANGHNDGCRYMNNEKQQFEHGEQYYNETYGGGEQ